MNGFLLVDKASGLTSHDVVAKIRRRFGTKKVGHAGTLDPMATGVLVLGIGNATRLLQYVVDGTKGYQATIALGKSTVTDDFEGELLTVAPRSALDAVTDSQIYEALEKMVGRISQRPSSVSAIKVGGKTGHERVRAGEEFELPSREVTISSIEIHSILRTESQIAVEISVICSAGTYIRAIARDLGSGLGVGGHLTALRRTLVSPFGLAECQSWEEAEPIATATGISRILPSRSLAPDELLEISFGRTISPNSEEGPVVALGGDGNFVALLENKTVGEKILATPSLVSVKE
jgi:tRNA pseudouridine55 synthase